ncbi:MAG: ornithine carbamoyltransferase [Alphaproteobacteria bacterium]|nr:ornithine carbamoyltransferase [Alphaproteobacteria bacterium]
MTGPRHFLDLDRLDAADLRAIIERAKRIKEARAGLPKGAVDPQTPLDGHILAALFERESTRTRVSFDVGMRQLGGRTMVLTGDEMQLGRGESVADTARVLSRFVDVLMLRTLRHDYLLELAEHASVPVINGLTQLTHPCQLMADVMTIEEHRGPIAGKVVAWTGDGNNVCASLVHAAVKFDFELRIATPKKYVLRPDVLDWAGENGGRVTTTNDPWEAVKNADCVFTDTFVSMGQTGREKRLERLAPFRVTARLLAEAKPDALFLHCLPAHRGEEMDADVIDGPQSVVWDEAENRLHVQKGILLWCLEK